jgi:hypothetical protein
MQGPLILRHAGGVQPGIILLITEMATELFLTQWWKTPNLKEDEETRKAVWTTTIA